MANGLINLGKYNILPQTSKTIAIPGYAKIVADKKYRGKEKTLTLSYKLNSDSLLLSKDEEIAHQQFVISDYKFPVLNSSETAAVFIIGKGMLLGNAIALGILTLQYFTGIIKLDAQTYYVSTVPVEFNWLAIIALNIATLLISIFMLVAPSYLISHIHPAKSMRYE